MSIAQRCRAPSSIGKWMPRRSTRSTRRSSWASWSPRLRGTGVSWCGRWSCRSTTPRRRRAGSFPRTWQSSSQRRWRRPSASASCHSRCCQTPK
eukprot:353382-Prymnesium_polylepis.1